MTTGFELRNRGFKFCRCDEFGTRLLGGRGSGLVRVTALVHELILSLAIHRIVEMYYKILRVYEWDEYKQSLPSIMAHVAAISAALQRYQARRAERGMFQLVPVGSSISIRVLSPLYMLPPPARAEARRRCRIQREKRKAAAAAGSVLDRPMA